MEDKWLERRCSERAGWIFFIGRPCIGLDRDVNAALVTLNFANLHSR